MRNRNLIEIKQPQESYCSNQECVNLTAFESGWTDMLDEYGLRSEKFYCLDCIIEEKVNE